VKALIILIFVPMAAFIPLRKSKATVSKLDCRQAYLANTGRIAAAVSLNLCDGMQLKN